MAARAPKCPNCGAQLPIRDGRSAACDDCGREAETRSGGSPPRPDWAARAGAAGRPGSGWGPTPRWIKLLPVAGLVIALGGGAAIFALRGINPLAGELQRQPGSAALAVDVDGDGTDDTIGLYRAPGQPAQLHAAAFTGDGVDEIWATESLGTVRDALPHTHLAAAGGVVAIADSRGRVRLVDAATGEQTGAVSLSDRATAMCGAPNGGAFWVEVAGGAHLRIDADTGGSKPVERPPWCPPGSGTSAGRPSAATPGE